MKTPTTKTALTAANTVAAALQLPKVATAVSAAQLANRYHREANPRERMR